MREVTITYYSFDELSDEAKKAAVESAQTHLPDYIFSEDDFDFCREDALSTFKDEMGIPREVELEGLLSMSYSQGDGFSVVGRVTKEEAPDSILFQSSFADEVEAVEWKTNSLANFYCHYNTVNMEFIDKSYYEFDEEPHADEVKELNGRAKTAMEHGHAKAIKTYEAMTSDEYIAERLSESILEFLSNGTLA